MIALSWDAAKRAAAAMPAAGKAANPALSPPAERIRRTISFLESFLDKRDQPPPAHVWARTVDMIEKECRQLKLLLEELSKGSE